VKWINQSILQRQSVKAHSSSSEEEAPVQLQEVNDAEEVTFDMKSDYCINYDCGIGEESANSW